MSWLKVGQASLTFSIPGRIELSATAYRGKQTPPLTGFQYPRSDRVVCNLWVALWGELPSSLSVSPVGSSCLQQIQEDQAVLAPGDFQYPRSDRVVCNEEKADD